jgi:hypothetical protein
MLPSLAYETKEAKQQRRNDDRCQNNPEGLNFVYERDFRT